MEMTTVFELRDKYFEKEGEKTKITGYDVDPKTGAIIVYAIEAVFKDEQYYSIRTGKPIDTDCNYVQTMRNQVGNLPMHIPGTGVVVYRTNSNGLFEVLLQERIDFCQYGLPGGGIEAGESYQMCAENELLQETAYIVEEGSLELCNVYAGPKHITRYPNGDIVYHTVVVFKVPIEKCKKASHNADKHETKSLQWMSFDQINQLIAHDKVFPNNRPILEDIVSKNLWM